MTTTFKKAGAPATPAQMNELERAIGAPVPAQLRTFLAQHDGAVPERDTFSVGSDNADSIAMFFSIGEMVHYREIFSSRVPQNLWPIGLTQTGNGLFIRLSDGALLFWDHETEQTTVVGGDLESFLAALRTPPTVELKPGQVIRVWVRPDILAKYGKKN